MSSDFLRHNWPELRHRIRHRWIELKAQDVEQINGCRYQLVERLEVRYAMTREQAERQVELWEAKLACSQTRRQPQSAQTKDASMSCSTTTREPKRVK